MNRPAVYKIPQDIGVEAVYGFEAGRQSVLTQLREVVEGIKSERINVDEYLPIVRNGNFDTMFDYAYSKAKSDILSEIDKLAKEGI